MIYIYIYDIYIYDIYIYDIYIWYIYIYIIYWYIYILLYMIIYDHISPLYSGWDCASAHLWMCVGRGVFVAFCCRMLKNAEVVGDAQRSPAPSLWIQGDSPWFTSIVFSFGGVPISKVITSPGCLEITAGELSGPMSPAASCGILRLAVSVCFSMFQMFQYTKVTKVTKVAKVTKVTHGLKCNFDMFFLAFQMWVPTYDSLASPLTGFSHLSSDLVLALNSFRKWPSFRGPRAVGRSPLVSTRHLISLSLPWDSTPYSRHRVSGFCMFLHSVLKTFG